MNGKVEKDRLVEIFRELSRAGNRMRRAVAASLPLLACALVWAGTCHGADRGQSADWALSEPQLRRVEAGAVIAEGNVAPDKPIVDIRAAIRIAASPEQVFRTLTDCARALRFVPHLKRCAVLESAPDGRWQNVEQTVDYGLLVPRASYVFHAEYEKFARIRFSNLRGDFRENRGVWTFRPLDDGRATVVTYEARVAPAFYVPRWMMRNMLKRDLPDLMRGLRTHAEAVRSAAATNVMGATPVLPDP
jgi:ribosome-associated toxin RatA of RatAB toxin-antitoxin module